MTNTVESKVAKNTFLVPDSRTAAHHAEARRYLPTGTSRIHYNFDPYPIYARSGRGCRLTDIDGVERLDFLNNMTALIHGHANRAITAAIVEQLERGTSFSEPSEPELMLARLLCERVPSMEQIHFRNSGTEAVMMAIKLARAYTGRSRIAKFEGFYHGYYDYVQISFNSTPSSWGPAERPASVPSSSGLSEGIGEDVLVLPYNDRAAVERLLEQHGRTLAALIIDPLSNRAGCPPPAPGFLDFLRRITRDYGIVFIYDEVITFRLGYAGAQGKYGGDPDLTALGKIMGGGLPVGAVGGRCEIMSLLDPAQGGPTVISGGTFSGNALSMVAGHAAMAQLTPAEFERLDRLGDRLRREGTALFRAAGVPGQLTGDGSLFLIVPASEPIESFRSLRPDAEAWARLDRLHLLLLDEGVIVARRGLACLSTPMGEAEVDTFLACLERALARLREES
ncbi:MAG TPA: aspartate aminotransferase family protein [Chloroflexota bacterium]|nr:aspartate aminotransferase family protein [Chloroflexota bacterium]